MPELPEVEVARLGISPHLLGEKIHSIVVRHKQLRWPIPDDIHLAHGHIIQRIERRAKYLLLYTATGTILLHLGMSGRLRVISASEVAQKHDHLDIVLSNGRCLRFTDPRRFGACLWLDANEQVHSHPLLKNLGPEPLTAEFEAPRLFQLSRNKSQTVKTFIMDNKVVVGVGNIYANESLFLAGIDPRKAAKDVTQTEYLSLWGYIREVLAAAIAQGGTTLKDFTQTDGKPGYFAQKLRVYGRAGEQCDRCGNLIESVVIGQRNSFYCPTCQQ